MFFPFNAKFQSRWNSGGSAASAAAAFLESWEEEAAAAMDFVRVVLTAFVGMPGALATGAFGGTTIVQGDNGGRAGAATDLLDVTYFQGMGKPLVLRLICWTRRILNAWRSSLGLPPLSWGTMVGRRIPSAWDSSLQLLRLSCTVRRIWLTSRIVSAEGHGKASSVREGHWQHCFQST